MAAIMATRAKALNRPVGPRDQAPRLECLIGHQRQDSGQRRGTFSKAAMLELDEREIES